MGTRRRSGWVAEAGLAAGAALLAVVLGGLTSYTQGLLPDALQPLANSPSGWTFLVILVLWWLPTRTWVTVLLGPVAFVLLTVGYALVSTARGFYYNPLLWSAIGVLVGPFLGLAVAWARSPAPRPADGAAGLSRWTARAPLGFGFLGGLLAGDAVSGFIRVRETTGWFYWTAMGAGALVWLGVAAVRRFVRSRDRLWLIGAAAVTGAAVVGGLELLEVLIYLGTGVSPP